MYPYIGDDRRCKCKDKIQQHYFVIVTEIEGEIEVDFMGNEGDLTGDKERGHFAWGR